MCLWQNITIKRKQQPAQNGVKMEKSSSSRLNFKAFRKLFSHRTTKSYKISPGNSYHSAEIKLNRLNTQSFDDSLNPHSADDAYPLKASNDRSDESKAVPDAFNKFIKSCNSTFCLTVLTPMACR